MRAREVAARVAISIAVVILAVVSSMILRILIWPALAWSEGRVNTLVIIWVALGVGVWFGGVIGFIGLMERLMARHSQRHFPTVVAACTVAGLVIGAILRRLIFEEAWASDYPLKAYAVLYAAGLLGALVGVWLMSETNDGSRSKEAVEQ